MKRNLQWVLDCLGIGMEELAQIINEACGRDPNRPIIYPEKCDNKDCETLFFSNTQDHMMRLKNGYATLCAKCREIDRKIKKRNYAKKSIKQIP